MNFLSQFFFLSAVSCADSSRKSDANSNINFAKYDNELTFAKVYLPSLFDLSLITDYFLKNESYSAELAHPHEVFFSDVYPHFHLSGSWEGAFWELYHNHIQESFNSASLVTLDEAMKAVLEWYEIIVDGEATRESVKGFLQSLYLKHFRFNTYFKVTDENMFLFLTFLVHRLNVPVEAEVISYTSSNNNMMDVDSVPQEVMSDATDYRVPPSAPANITNFPTLMVFDEDKIKKELGKEKKAKARLIKEQLYIFSSDFRKDVWAVSNMEYFFEDEEKIKKKGNRFIRAFLRHVKNIYVLSDNCQVESKWSDVLLEICKHGFPITPKTKVDLAVYVLQLHRIVEKSEDRREIIFTEPALKFNVEDSIKYAWKDPNFYLRSRSCLFITLSYLAYYSPKPAQ